MIEKIKTILYKAIVVGLIIFVIGLGLLLFSVVYDGIWGSIARDLSFVLIPISLMVFVYEYFLRKDWADLIKKCMEEETFIKSGGKKVFSDFKSSDIEDAIAMAKVEICIMQSFVPQILRESVATVEKWESLFHDALERKCEFKILLLSPHEMAYITNRATQLKIDPQEFRKKIIESIKFFENLKKKGKVEIKVFTEYPIGPVFIIDKTLLYQGFFLPNTHALATTVIKIEINKGEEGPLQVFWKTFQKVWNESEYYTSA